MWTLDPIDGTKGFLRGEQYAVCLALIVDSRVELGVMGCPNLPHDLTKPDGPRGAIFVAVRGQGAEQVRPFAPSVSFISLIPKPSAILIIGRPQTSPNPPSSNIRPLIPRIRRSSSFIPFIQRSRLIHPRNHETSDADGFSS